MEYVVLLDDAGRSIGIEPKATVHTTETPLHLAFSAYVFDRRGNLLITRRALEKVTWPGVWTNSCCGHPAPEESLEDTVRRRLNQELGIDVDDVSLALPFFRYRAVMDTGIVENEICPVFRVIYDGPQPLPDPEEVESAEWVDWQEFSDSVLSSSRDVSPWCREQVQQLRQLGLDPGQWPTADAAALPPAAREGMDRRLPR
ncbi:isopentenyl-diphosphate Delta-isomerase [Rhodococcus sp. KBS0724]|jgi:isopentenyl-diphosphate delta-isomerase|uniref:isopentenyl-diphosphate Delta-isomerase n=1 Tax=Rhodococcus sp. KBS0724 TaxID=1179674 RepID=UPI00110D32FB|nr:isopentenyl-diphosphate Delta-isomerase [Rhodococcus sp. KBS0724]TSD49955.1 isopentenyl-diphosphate Delta-isomerase [Rhodococcus sp. KBS0724]